MDAGGPRGAGFMAVNVSTSPILMESTSAVRRWMSSTSGPSTATGGLPGPHTPHSLQRR